MPVRIAVSGAHGVGKTTFCFDLKRSLESDSLHSVHVFTEVARALRAEGIPINRETKESQYALFFEKHVSNLFLGHSAEYLVYDRTILDSLAYGLVNGNLDQNWVRFVSTLASFIMKQVNWYFFIPIEFPLSADGIRNVETEYQTKVDEALVGLVRRTCPEFVMLTGSRSERVGRALSLIRQSDDRA